MSTKREGSQRTKKDEKDKWREKDLRSPTWKLTERIGQRPAA